MKGTTTPLVFYLTSRYTKGIQKTGYLRAKVPFCYFVIIIFCAHSLYLIVATDMLTLLSANNMRHLVQSWSVKYDCLYFMICPTAANKASDKIASIFKAPEHATIFYKCSKVTWGHTFQKTQLYAENASMPDFVHISLQITVKLIQSCLFNMVHINIQSNLDIMNTSVTKFAI